MTSMALTGSLVTEKASDLRRPVRWHIGVFLAPALLIYTVVMVIPLVGSAVVAFLLYSTYGLDLSYAFF